MPTALTATLLGALAALPLLVGAWLALRYRLGERVLGGVAAFGAGALLSAVSFELVLDAIEIVSAVELAVGLAAGALTYYGGDRLLSRGATAGDHAARGRALMLGATLDGIPESFILGVSTIAAAGVSLAFLAAVIVSNRPEGMAAGSSGGAAGAVALLPGAAPATPVAPFPAEVEWVDEIAGRRLSTHTDWMRSCSRVTVTAHPAVSVPCGFTADGLPVRLRLVGRYGDEAGLLAVAAEVVEATGAASRGPAL